MGLPPMPFQRKDFRREATISIACVGVIIAIVVGFAVRDIWRTHDGTLAGGRERSAVSHWFSKSRQTLRSSDRSLIVRHGRNFAAIARNT